MTTQQRRTRARTTGAAVLIAGLVTSAFGCHPHDHDHEGGHGHHDDHDDHDDHHDDHDDHDEGGHGHGHDHGEGAIAVTTFTDKTELFAEFPQMILGEDPVTAAVHITHLSDFSPAITGSVTVELQGPKGTERFTAPKIDRKGIFEVALAPTREGVHKARVIYTNDGVDDVHAIQSLPVFASREAAEAAHEEEEEEAVGEISFLKEQQWLLPFRTENVAARRMRPSFSAYGTVRARADGQVHVTAPVSGRLTNDKLPTLGEEVAAGQTLAVVTPSLADLGDGAAFTEAVATARVELQRAQSDRQRLEKLFADGVIPEKRVIDARFAEKRARAVLTAAASRQGQRRRISSVNGRGGKPLELRSPLGGIIVKVGAPAGSYVAEGSHLFHVVNLDELWLEVQVSEAHVTALAQPRGAWFRVEGIEEAFELGPEDIVATGGVVDKHTRTIPLVLRIQNADRRLRVGMFADVNIISAPPRTAVAVPVRSLVYEAGLPVVYVQTGGESFVRRQVRVGERDGDYIEIVAGVEAGERVVSRGGYAVRLASAEGSLPAHGHAH